MTRLHLAQSSCNLSSSKSKRGTKRVHQLLHLKCIGDSYSHNTALQRQKLKGHRELLHRSGKTGMELVTDTKPKDFPPLYFILQGFEPLGLRARIIAVILSPPSSGTPIHTRAIQRKCIPHKRLTSCWSNCHIATEN